MIEGKRALDPKVIALLSTPHARLPGADGSYGYGLNIAEHRGIRVLEHGGSRTGYGSSIRMAPEQRAAVIVVTNRSGATLPATAEKALELMVPLKPEAKPPARETLEIASEDVARLTGVYANGDQKLEIVERNGKPMLVLGAAEVPLVKRGRDRWGYERGGAEYVALEGPSGKIEYLTAGTRTFARR
jgi:CubicO group peptidase (beta-lactamase class C family)